MIRSPARDRMMPADRKATCEPCLPPFPLTELSRFFFPSHATSSADVAIVFGATSWQAAAQCAVSLHRAGRVATLLFTGGFNARAAGVEAVLMAETAAAQGIPERDMLVEPHARHTRENAQLAKALLTKDAPAARTALAVTIDYHARRACLALQAELYPRIAVVGCEPYPSTSYTRDNWSQSSVGRRDVASEFAKIERDFPAALSHLKKF